MAARLLIVDDHEAVRMGVRMLFTENCSVEVCGEAQNGVDAIRMVSELSPDVVILDLSMPGMNGLEVARLLRQELPEAKILVISQHDPIHLLPRVLEVGGNACVDKSRLGTDLLAGIKSIEVLPALSGKTC